MLLSEYLSIAQANLSIINFFRTSVHSPKDKDIKGSASKTLTQTFWKVYLEIITLLLSIQRLFQKILLDDSPWLDSSIDYRSGNRLETPSTYLKQTNIKLLFFPQGFILFAFSFSFWLISFLIWPKPKNLGRFCNSILKFSELRHGMNSFVNWCV